MEYPWPAKSRLMATKVKSSERPRISSKTCPPINPPSSNLLPNLVNFPVYRPRFTPERLEASFLILTLLKAALFTAIVTSFSIDAMSSLSEDTSTQLLHIIAEQSTTGLNVDIPPPNIPPSILTVNALWLLSITASLTATTWAILSLEWCTFLTDDIEAEDYQGMAEKRQLRFEAIKRWKMDTVVASIPFLLHISLFFFLAGLWLRVRDMNNHLGLVVGIPSLGLVSSYVIVTFLPMFTEAPFFTSFSVILFPLIDQIKYLFKFRRLIRAPPVLEWISRPFAWILGRTFSHLDPAYRRCLYLPLRVTATLLIHSLKYVYKFTSPLTNPTWVVTMNITRTIFPTIRPGGNPFEELKMLRTRPSDPDKGVHQRALLRLINSPLTQSEMMEVFITLSNIRGPVEAEERLDRSVLELLVITLSSILEDDRITEDEQPIFDYCTRLLTEEMGRTFRDVKYDPTILVRNTVISDGLKRYVSFDASTPPPQTSEEAYDDYWNKVILFLWLSPSKEQIWFIIAQLEPSAQSMKAPLLQRVVRGLHAATMIYLRANEQQSVLDFPLPNFNRLKISNDEPDRSRIDLDKESLAFLQNLFAEFHKAAQPAGQKFNRSSITIPSLIVDCIKLFDEHPQGGVPLKFQGILSFFVTMVWKNDPGAFDADPSVFQALVTSVAELNTKTLEDRPNLTEEIAIRLLTIANGPKFLASWQQLTSWQNLTLRQQTPPVTIASLYAGPVKDDSRCLLKYIHVAAAALESILSRENRPGVPDFRYFVDRRVAQTIVHPSFFTDRLAFDYSLAHPDYRLPYLYSLVIALSCGVRGTEHNPLEVLRLLRTSDGLKGNAAIERILDTNTLVATSLRRVSRVLTDAELRDYLDPVAQALEPLEGIIEDGKTYSLRTRWKAIYLLADIRNVLPRAPASLGELQSLIDGTSRAARAFTEELRDKPVPADWKMKREGLISNNEKNFFSRFSHLFLPFLRFFSLISTSISHVGQLL